MAKSNSYAGQTCLPMKSDKTTSEYGTSTDAGKSKVTEGKEMEAPTGKKGPHGKGSKKGSY